MDSGKNFGNSGDKQRISQITNNADLGNIGNLLAQGREYIARHYHMDLALVGSPYKSMQVWKHRPVLLCKHLIFRHVSPEAMMCNLLKLLTYIVLWGLPFTGTKFYYVWSIHLSQFMVSILIGIVLQLLWEDRPITEPL